MRNSLIITLLIISTFSCNNDEGIENKNLNNFTEKFDSQNHLDTFWKDASQNESPQSYHLENNNLKITTRANLYDRVKIQTKKTNFSIGSYTWKVYVPKYNLNEQCSIGAFLYNDDNHELDFEIGSGTNQLRAELNAQSNDMVIYCTSQGFPFSSNQFLIQSEAWHNLKIELSKGENNNYLVKWYINSDLVKTLQTNFQYDIGFGIYNSLENLNFMGDFLPVVENYTLFDSFYFEE